jgi:NAD-dependent DNA ligase
MSKSNTKANMNNRTIFDALQHDPESILAKMNADEIAGILEEASDAYYIKGKPVLSDDLYDIVFDYLKKKAPNHPAIQRIGAPIQPGKKVELPYWMGSLDKIRDDPKALTRWVNSYSDPSKYVVSDKLDGNSGLLVYDKKKTIALYSRGDGTYGQNVSHLLEKINGIVPIQTMLDNKKKSEEFSLPLAVRGELIISRKNWDQIKDLGANARNVVAGAMHAANPDDKIANKIDFVAYELLEPRMTPSDGLLFLKNLGFMVSYFESLNSNDMTMDKLSNILVSRRRDSPYEVDGIVLAHDKEYKRIRDRNPRHMFAFKSLLTHDEAEVIITKVEWNVSKDGYIKPLVHFPTVVIEGAKISKATGFNAAYIEQNKIGPGSRIVVIRSGAVIPHIVRVMTPASNGKPAFPDIPYKWNETHVDIIIEQDTNENADVMIKRMEYFVNTLDIKSVGPGTIKKLYSSGFDTIPKLLAAKKEDVMKLEGFKSTSAQNIVDGLAMVASVRCADLMAASSLFGRGIGAKKLAPVLEVYPTIADMDAPVPTYEQLLSIQGMGDVSAKAILEGIVPFRKFLKEIGHRCNVKPILRQQPQQPQQSQPSQPLQPSQSSQQPTKNPSGSKSVKTIKPIADMSGMTIVFTGFRNKEWENMITDAGGKNTTSISKNTSIVVAADVHEESGKLKKARELGVSIMSRDDFAKKYDL